MHTGAPLVQIGFRLGASILGLFERGHAWSGDTGPLRHPKVQSIIHTSPKCFWIQTMAIERRTTWLTCLTPNGGLQIKASEICKGESECFPLRWNMNRGSIVLHNSLWLLWRHCEGRPEGRPVTLHLPPSGSPRRSQLLSDGHGASVDSPCWEAVGWEGWRRGWLASRGRKTLYDQAILNNHPIHFYFPSILRFNVCYVFKVYLPCIFWTHQQHI